ncbi:uncharacterized protein LOC114543338 [Dendronephthya gigantea]|nr:uncharacterized protein LOC114541832 [Dendronephthya gigantea]XP_028418165.1 uncharacterized protein LOC114543338 [Dendronephthya gigantea]
MYYRKWSDDEWMGPISLLKSTPMDMPVQIPADFAKADLPKLAVDMQKWFSVMTSTAQGWWESFLQTTGNNDATIDNTFPIFSLKNHVRRPNAEPVETAEIPAQLSALREKELEQLEEIYTGSYQAPASRGINMDDNYLAALKPDVFVAVNISNYKKRPVIGKVTEVGNDEFCLQYWKGNYSTAWEPHIVNSKDGLTP